MGILGDVLQMNVGQILQTPTIPAVDFTGKTIVITGANTGLGLEAAKHIYSLNASHLILACRDLRKGEHARTKIQAREQSASEQTQTVEVWQLDMANFGSVIAFGERLRSLNKLHAFIANAGIDVAHWEMFEEMESTLTVNVVSTMLLAVLAIPQLQKTSEKESQPSYLTFTGSVVHIFAKDQYLSRPKPGTIFQSLNNQATADMNDRYLLSKLLLLLCVRGLARRVDRTNLIVNYVNPGWCKTELFRTHDGGFGGRVGLRLIGRTAEEGSRTLVHGITAGAVSHGKYLSECRIKPESNFVRSESSAGVQERVWSELVTILETIRPGATKILTQ
ncbi:hypothetical protein LTR10_023470 [Elasticomyces elasticus]|uniref:NAD(P)-binding protein n=1 Tax=Exophiala sideris TaxID=1016849 RepID=A0ABR0IXA6_9EURO|nr:hypothetical protein LTR10_023470 [Elasticomyces elasticus]KAK5021878.1 hypothetical protein LTS07_010619 [Exophiala sideris]KAK5025943.1 hypothetical protein LTR13_010256 [Exophiala sideris]KAK5050308.1 hypothetical protein LTR69_010643 [Exophiala sideris]KAK5177087.1 hypothetical protein LTR44_010371 [Eurotiomycetes sp. CCFEE 6388]